MVAFKAQLTLVDSMDLYAAEEECSRSEVIRRALSQYLNYGEAAS